MSIKLPVMPENPTHRQVQEYCRQRSRIGMIASAKDYSEHMHKHDPTRTLSTADKKLRGRVLSALRVFGRDNAITDDTAPGRLLLRVLREPDTMLRIGIAINTKTAEETLEPEIVEQIEETVSPTPGTV